MLTEEELIELLRSQLSKAETALDNMADLLREAYVDLDLSQDLKEQIEDLFNDLDIDL